MMRRFKTLAVLLVFSLCLCGFMTGCNGADSGNNTEKDSVTGIKLKYNDNEIGDSLSVDLSDGPLAFTADVQVKGNASKDFTLTSSATDIATVSDKNVALVAVGQTTITATATGNPAKTHAITLNVIIEEPATPGMTKPYNITNNFDQDSSSDFLVQWHNDVSISKQKLQIVPETEGFGNTKQVMVRMVKKFESTGLVGNFPARNVFKAYVTGLSPNTRYKYRMGDNGAWSDTFYHLTSSGNADDFSFTVLSDPQSEAHTDMANALRAADAFDPDSKFYLMGGDLVDEIAMRPAEIISYTTTANEFNKYKPIAATQGNHDTYYDGSLNGTSNQYRFGEATVFNKFVTFPDNGWDTDPKKADRGQSYYFYYNKVFIIMLNTMATANSAGTSSPNYTKQVEWLKSILEKDRAQGLSRYTIIFTHISPFYGRSSNNSYSTSVFSSHGKVFTDYGVDIVFAGHDHIYGRSNPIKITGTNLSEVNFESTPGGTIFSIVGATGPKFYTLDSSNDMVPKFYPKRTDDQSPGVYLNVKVTAEKLTVTAMRVDGKEIDKYEVEAKK